ncbi:putative acyltransferase-like protein, chloroplastic [Iris pallida]|uniref:Acyltransferase-like protein, chloroplastic n=1 Tax=Iris pallida TaxID=29817 RepID=A0AAX6I7W9_IRIPA|nr:putative acyltransferase-like protein, chloroplastic [Iris pallida]
MSPKCSTNCRVFEVRCLHIPLDDRTPFEGLVKLIENTVKDEHTRFPSRPLYLLGDSFGGCLALAIAARNPHIDLVLILVNPATSFNKSQLSPFIPVLGYVQLGILYALSLILGGPLKMAATRSEEALLSRQTLDELSRSVSSLIPLPSDLTDKIRNDILLWKLELLKSGASYSNSRLHAVEAQVLMLISGNDNLLPSADEAGCLWTKLKTRKVRHFKDSGHSLLLEDGINLITIIKGTRTYRRSRQFDFVTDYLPPTLSEFRKLLVQDFSLLRIATSPVFLSTLDDGRIVRGLSGVPNEGPVLFVGYHMLMGLELFFFAEQLLREKNIAIRALAHPYLGARPETSQQKYELFDGLIVFGGLPVSAKHIFKLFSTKSFILLYPGGSREAHHRKGEAYKLFWPDQPEFVRMAARFGATIVPFGVVGEDDIAELVFDYDDQMKIPYLKRWIEDHNKQAGGNIRAGTAGEVANQDMYFPGVIPKVPGRFYYLFGKPVETRGMGYLKDRDSANEVYLRIKSDVEGLISYLKTKREEDPYRSIVKRTMSQYSKVDPSEVPTFEP